MFLGVFFFNFPLKPVEVFSRKSQNKLCLHTHQGTTDEKHQPGYFSELDTGPCYQLVISV